MKKIVVFSGQAHPDLARALCRRLKVPLSPSTTTTFSNDCLGVQLGTNCRQADVFIVQPLAPPVQHHLLEVLARHFRRRTLKNTVVVSPDLGNAKEASHLARSLELPLAAGSKKRLSD